MVKIEFLADLDDTPNQQSFSFNDCESLGAVNLRGTGYASKDWETRTITADLGGQQVSVQLRVATLPAYLLPKTHAAHGRGLTKDWYDIAYVLLHNDEGGPTAAASLVRERFSNSLVFDEADRRDPRHQRQWIALVDGNNHQIERIGAEAAAREISVTIIIDLIHVMEYLWGAAWSFFAEGDAAAEIRVRAKALATLQGNARHVAAGIRRRATTLALSAAKRKKADACATYLTNKAPYLDYPTALEAGWPIASGVIEGTCRYLVADRMDITGARWSVEGAEAVLKLRAVRSNGDFVDYYRFHLEQERRRVHESRYANNIIPVAA